MTWRIDWSRHAQQDLRTIDHGTAERILSAIERLAEQQQGDVRRLQGLDPPEWRLRVGDWRVRFAYDFEERRLLTLRVLPRGQAYRD